MKPRPRTLVLTLEAARRDIVRLQRESRLLFSRKPKSVRSFHDQNLRDDIHDRLKEITGEIEWHEKRVAQLEKKLGVTV